MTRQEKRGLGFAMVALGLLVLTAAIASARLGRPGTEQAVGCGQERAAYELAQTALDRAPAADDEALATELAQARDEAFARYCDCLRALALEDRVPRAPVFTPGRRGTPPFASTPGRPVFTPPGPPPGRPPVTLPPTTPRGRPPFTPPGPPLTVPPRFTPPPLTPPVPPPTRTP